MQETWNYITGNKLEVIAAILGLLCVVLAAKEFIINWPIAIASSILYTCIFYKDMLYGDACLNAVFVVMCAYGWYEWAYGGKNKTELPIAATKSKTAFILTAITLVIWLIIARIEILYTKSTVPYLDGLTTAMSIAATWMQARKLIESWLVWIVADIIYVGMYIIKDLYITSVLYFIFTLLAVYGYMEWKKQLTAALAE